MQKQFNDGQGRGQFNKSKAARIARRRRGHQTAHKGQARHIAPAARREFARLQLRASEAVAVAPVAPVAVATGQGIATPSRGYALGQIPPALNLALNSHLRAAMRAVSGVSRIEAAPVVFDALQALESYSGPAAYAATTEAVRAFVAEKSKAPGLLNSLVLVRHLEVGTVAGEVEATPCGRDFMAIDAEVTMTTGARFYMAWEFFGPSLN